MLHLTRHPKLSAAANLSIVALLIALAYAVVESVFVVYLDTFLNDAALVGLISAGYTTLLFLGFLLTGPLIERSDERTLWILAAGAIAFGYIGYAVAPTLGWFLTIGAALALIHPIQIQLRSVLIRDNSHDTDIAANQGLNYALRNVGWLLGPIIGGFALAASGFPVVFVIAAGFILLAIIHFRNLPLKHIDHDLAEADYKHLITHAKTFFRSPEYLKTYFMNGGVSFWWGVIFLYGPLYITRQGLPPSAVGWFLALTMLPLVVLEYPIGTLVAKHGHRRFLLTGHLILAGCALSAYLANNTYLTLTALILGSIGASMLEGTKESYYYAVTPQRDEEKYLGVWMTAVHLSSTVAKLTLAGVVFLLPFRYAWLGLGGAMLVYSAIASTVRK